MNYITSISDREYEVEILDDRQVSINGRLYGIDFEEISEGRVYSMLIDGKSIEAYVYPGEDGWQVLVGGRLYPAIVEDKRERLMRLAAGSESAGRSEVQIKAPMPGLVVAVLVADGQTVVKGDVLVILESMKMQNELKSPRAGMIERVRVNPGDRVEQHAALMTVL